MKMNSQTNARPSLKRLVPNRTTGADTKRHGSALMIVMVLMGMLALLGVIFYTFASQERGNAEYYSDAAKNLGEPSLTADILFDWALEQIIVGTDRRLTNSMLWGSRHSMLSNALGVGYNSPGDLHPFNGEGVNLIYDANGNIAVDQNRNGLPDDGTGTPPEKDYRYLLDYNDSPAAYKLYDSGERQVFNGPAYYPETDVGYTYPDINNVFLTYVGKARDANGNVHQIVKPAYLVPGLLRSPIGGISAPLTFEDTNNNGVLDAGEDANGNGILDDWCVNPNTASRIMRAHPKHIYVPSTGIPTNPQNRYLTATQASALIGPSAYGFPFHPMAATYNTTTAAGVAFNNGRMGPYSGLNTNPTNDPAIEFDYDNDGDQVNEAILMDLDFPPQQDASGNLFVPLFLITIHDLDALSNLNVHGNLAKILLGPGDGALADTAISNTANPFGFSNPVAPATAQFNYLSQSNLGISPSEVNPLWVLNSRFGTDTSAGSTLFAAGSPYALFYGASPQALSSPNPIWGETANMEFAWSKIGRLNYTSGAVTDLLPGVYGEEYLLYAAQQGGTLATPGGHNLPRPGTSLLDDNYDLNEGQQDYSPYYQHPLDYTGLGYYVSPTNPKLLNWSTAVGQNQWITYTNYGNNSNTATSSNILWGQRASTINPMNSLLMTNSLTQGLGDDPNEISFYTPFSAIDHTYTPDEMLYLNLNNTEIDRLNVTSRLASLFPYNFAKTIVDNPRGAVVRKKFTTESNDRKSFGLPLSVRALGTAAIGLNVQGAISNSIHGQEYTLDTNTVTYKFPPQFGPVNQLVPRYSMTAVAPLGVDPIRPATRTLLEVELNSQMTQNRLQRKLSINQVLTGDQTLQPAFRDLTAHPADPGAATINTVSGYTDYPPTTAAGAEYWARNDRQKMARDIYTLLYVLGHGDDTVITATTANATPSPLTDGSTMYSELQLREMAQFAVNLVDSMDRDSVITRFEYDKDLSDGWNLDDDPYGALEATAYATGSSNYNPSYPNDSATRGEVYGIERLDLSIAESLFIQAKKSQLATPANYNQTNWDDSNGDHFFFFVELRNQGPLPITFDAPHAAWQIVLRQDAGAGAPWERRLTLKNGATMDTLNSGPTSNTSYVIGSADVATTAAGTIPAGSSFAVDPSWGGAPSVRIAPNRTGTTLDCDLDLITTVGSSNLYQIQDQSGTDLTATSGAMLNALSGTTPNLSAVTLKVLLRRRSNPTRAAAATDVDNPWVEVDSMMLQLNKGLKVFDMGAAPNGATAQTQLTQAVSLERPQPLDGASQAISTGSSNVATTFAYNTLGAVNSVTPLNTPMPPPAPATPLYLWQAHFDRSFASLMDLLYVPVFGPHQLTELARTAYADPPSTQVLTSTLNPNWVVGASPGIQYPVKAKSAASKFMVPEDPSNASATPPVRALDNRWHRILEFLEVPTRTNANLGAGTALAIPRVPGRMNLNMLRHCENFAALMDDSRSVTLNLTPATGTADPDTPTLDDKTSGTTPNTGDPNRDWWHQFLLSRDTVEPYTASSVGLPLPGLPNSKPFRNIADVGYSYTGTTPVVQHPSVADTILRPLPLDPAGASQRHLLEIGSLAEHQNQAPATNNPVDPYIRNRLLSKIYGNSTTRSNCFAVFISVKYFQAVENNGAVQIGGPLNGVPDPEHRGFFVVDRSKLESGQTSSSPTYNFRAFVDYRKTLQTQ